jgi:hypothetical protein
MTLPPDTFDEDARSSMTAQQLRDHLEALGQTQTEAAKIFKVTSRSMRAYAQEEGTPVPQAMAMSLRLARRLRKNGLWWLPLRRSTTEMLQPLKAQERDAVARRRVYDLRVPEILARIGARGGPVTPWDVDLERGRATLGTMRLEFTLLPKGGFVPLAYKRTDQPPDSARDCALLEDGYACIGRALEKAGRSALPPKCLSRARLVGDNAVLWDERPAPEVVVVVARADVLSIINHEKANDVDVLSYLDSRRATIAEIAFRSSHARSEQDAHGVKEIRLHADALRPMRETFDPVVIDDADQDVEEA